MTGLLLVDKPPGTTSAGVIRTLKPRFGSAKVGHLGTLDPFASGLLPLCVGEATKVARYLFLEDKAYEGTICLGSTTDTLDGTGSVTATAALPTLDDARVERIAEQFTGRLEQTPPMYSALKRDGVPLYALARRGIEVERAARTIEIRTLSLVVRGVDRLEFSLSCSKGTYVRVLAADIGVALGTVAHLERLRRTAVGRFRVEEAHGVDALATDARPLPLIDVRTALSDLPAFAIGADGLGRLRRGQQAPLGGLPHADVPGQPALLLDADGRAAAVIEAAGPHGAWRLVRMLATA